MVEEKMENVGEMGLRYCVYPLELSESPSINRFLFIPCIIDSWLLGSDRKGKKERKKGKAILTPDVVEVLDLCLCTRSISMDL